MAKTSIDISELNAAIARSAKIEPEVRRTAMKVLWKQSDALRLAIKARMPVDTGFAQWRWGEKQGKRNPASIWIEKEGATELSIEQGAGLEPYEYIERLNAGWSKQAPAGFLDAEADRFAKLLEDELEEGLVVTLEKNT